VTGGRAASHSGEEVVHDRDRAGELGVDVLELAPGTLGCLPKPLVFLLDRVDLTLKLIVLGQHPPNDGDVILDRLDPLN
jgi:hypothetical protein